MTATQAEAVPSKNPTGSERSEATHKESLLDEALAETFPASDPISPAYEARLEADAEDGNDNVRLRSMGASVASGLFGVGVAAALVWLASSLVRRQLRL